MILDSFFFALLLAFIGIIGYVGGYADGFQHGKKAAERNEKTAP